MFPPQTKNIFFVGHYSSLYYTVYLYLYLGESGIKPGSRVQPGYLVLAVCMCASIAQVTKEIRFTFEKEAAAITRKQKIDL